MNDSRPSDARICCSEYQVEERSWLCCVLAGGHPGPHRGDAGEGPAVFWTDAEEYRAPRTKNDAPVEPKYDPYIGPLTQDEKDVLNSWRVDFGFRHGLSEAAETELQDKFDELCTPMPDARVDKADVAHWKMLYENLLPQHDAWARQATEARDELIALRANVTKAARELHEAWVEEQRSDYAKAAEVCRRVAKMFEEQGDMNHAGGAHRCANELLGSRSCERADQ